MTKIAPESIDFLNLPSLPLKSRKDLPNCQGIYFVISSQGTIQYIGCTKNLRRRWQQHHRLGQLEKYFDVKIAWLEVSESELLPEIEKALIKWFKPYLNQTTVEGRKTVGNGRGRPRGNPDFGSKYRFDFGREKALSAQVKAQVDPEVKQQLQNLANQKQCTVPDLIREAIEQYLVSEQTHSR